ncbi:MAG: hypothetical protein HC859_11835 [Bacteroidia bacterium]|nr:hypothetical protein [Bacteroidia bacterium]
MAASSKEIKVYPLAGIENNPAKIMPRIWKKHHGELNKVVYAPDGNFLASSSYENELVLWRPDGAVAKEFDRIQDPINAIAFSYDSKILVGLDVTGRGASWAIPGGTKFADFHGHDNTVFCAAFAPSLTGNYVVASAGGINNEILLWNPINGSTVKKIKGKGNAVQALTFNDDMELFVSRESTKNGKPQFNASFNFASLTLNRNPGNVAPSKDLRKDVQQTAINELQLPKNKIVKTDEAEDGRILDYLVLADGSVLVASDFSLKMFDRNGLINKEFIGHTGAVRAIAVSKDGKYMASGGEDQSIIIWENVGDGVCTQPAPRV